MASYLLMHRDIPVAEWELDTVSGVITSVGEVFEPRHVPVGIPVKRGVIDRGVLNAWWRGRAVPVTRQGIQDALLKMHLPDTQLLPEKCQGLSLSDSYWICPAGSKLSPCGTDQAGDGFWLVEFFRPCRDRGRAA